MTPYRIWRAQRSGYTLVEMLIVVSIMIMLIAVTLPVAKKVMDGSQGREASRQLNAFFAMAKARALQTGRPCGIYFAMPTAPLGIVEPTLTAAQFSTYWPVRHCSELQLAETPAPYAGSVTSAIGRINTTTNLLELGDSSSAPSSTSTEITTLKSLLDLGEQFLIRFNFKGDWYVCEYNSTTSNLTYKGPLWTDATVRPHGGTGVPFEILRSPRPAGNSLTLPTGTCVDMTYSGIGTNSRGFLFGSNVGSVQSRVTGMTVLLDPNGGVQSIYLDTQNQRRVFLGPPAASLHFLVGKTEKADNPLPVIANPPVATVFANPELSNLADPTALWVVVSRGTGQVTTTENMPLAGSASVSFAQYLRDAREAATTGDHMIGR